MAQDDEAGLEKTLLAEETAVWEALVRGDMQADVRALDPAFLGVYPDGFSDKAAHVAQLSDGPTVQSFCLSEARVLPLGADQALLAYRADYQRQGAAARETMFVSSIWRREGAGWVNLFSQDTPAALDWKGP